MVPLAKTMRAVVLTGHGGLDKLVVRDDLPLPAPGPGEVLIAVGACGVNNTDINTRTAWYSKSVTSATDAGALDGLAQARSDDSTWGGSGLVFPRIQGADVAGRIVALGPGVAESRIGERVLVDPWLRDPQSGEPGRAEGPGFLGSERDGGFAQFTVVPAVNAFALRSALSDAELATFPCAYSTAENMLTRAGLAAGETVLVTGASGGVGSGLVQLAKRRGARVVGLAGRAKLAAVEALGADAVVPRETKDPVAAVHAAVVRAAGPGGQVDVVADVVGGAAFASLLELLARGGRYVTSGAIAGPIVELDLRTLYLQDLTLLGATVMARGIFAALVGYIERGEVRPLLAKTFRLEDLRTAQSEFLEKRHVGNYVVLP